MATALRFTTKRARKLLLSLIDMVKNEQKLWSIGN